MILKTSEMRTGNDSQTLKPCTPIHRWRKRAVYSTSAVSLVLIASFVDLAQAADSVNWNGSSSNDWFTDSNWSWDGHTPLAGDTAQINTGAALISTSTNAAAGTLFIGVNNSGSLDLDGNLTTNTMTLGYNAGSSGTLTIDAGTLTNTGFLYIGNAGAGSIVMDNGASASATGTTYLGTAAGGSGTLTLDHSSHFTTSDIFFLLVTAAMARPRFRPAR